MARAASIRFLSAMALWGVACVALSACGYSTSNLLRDDIKSVCVLTFDNQTWYRGLEKGLSKAVAEEIELHTRMRPADRHEADSFIEGELLSFDEALVAESEDGFAQVKRVTVAVRFRWVDNLTRRDIVPWQTIEEPSNYVVALGEPVEARPFRDVAKRIVERMQKSW